MKAGFEVQYSDDKSTATIFIKSTATSASCYKIF